MAMSGSGVKTSLGIIRPAMLQILKALLQDRVASCVAVPGTVTMGACDPPIAAGAIQASGTTSTGFVLCVALPGLIKPYAFTLLHFLKSGLHAGRST